MTRKEGLEMGNQFQGLKCLGSGLGTFAETGRRRINGQVRPVVAQRGSQSLESTKTWSSP